MTRQCGSCTACCRLLPVAELDKPAHTRCPHVRTLKGCSIYPTRPHSCRAWSCMWLVGTRDGQPLELSRPDRSGYVLDMLPDYITLINNETGERHDYTVMQIWVDPARPHAHRDPALRKMLDDNGIIGLVRYGERDGFTLWPPSRCADHQWHEQGSAADFTRELSLIDEIAAGRRSIPHHHNEEHQRGNSSKETSIG